MKRLFCFALVGVFALSAQAFSSSSHIAPHAVRQSFTREFGNVKEVNWSPLKENLTKASFMLDDQEISAFFDNAGDLVATTVSLQKHQLPIKLRIAIDAKLGSVSLSEMYYVEHSSETAYYFNAVKDGQTKTYQAFDNGRITEVKLGWLK